MDAVVEEESLDVPKAADQDLDEVLDRSEATDGAKEGARMLCETVHRNPI